MSPMDLIYFIFCRCLGCEKNRIYILIFPRFGVFTLARRNREFNPHPGLPSLRSFGGRQHDGHNPGF